MWPRVRAAIYHSESWLSKDRCKCGQFVELQVHTSKTGDHCALYTECPQGGHVNRVRRGGICYPGLWSGSQGKASRWQNQDLNSSLCLPTHLLPQPAFLLQVTSLPGPTVGSGCLHTTNPVRFSPPLLQTPPPRKKLHCLFIWKHLASEWAELRTFRLKSNHSETDSEFHQLAYFPTISFWDQNGSPFSFLQGNDSNACSVPSASFLLVPCTSPLEPSHTYSRPQTKMNPSTVLSDTEDLPDSRMSSWSALWSGCHLTYFCCLFWGLKTKISELVHKALSNQIQSLIIWPFTLSLCLGHWDPSTRCTLCFTSFNFSIIASLYTCLKQSSFYMIPEHWWVLLYTTSITSTCSWPSSCKSCSLLPEDTIYLFFLCPHNLFNDSINYSSNQKSRHFQCCHLKL